MGGWKAWPSPPAGRAGEGGGGGNRPRNSLEPSSHPQSTGAFHSSVPLWEKKFCSDVCMIPWKLLCENKKFISYHKNVLEWDDSGALEAFQNAKSRFWAHYHRVSCDIPLPDPEMYIDEVDPYGFVDPDLIADLERRILLPQYENVDSNNSCLLLTDAAAPTGWDDADNTGGKCQLVNWDAYIEQPTQVNTWGDGTVPSSSCWDTKNGCSDAWNTSGCGWDAGARQNGSRRNMPKNYGNDSFACPGNQAGAMQDDSWNRSKYSCNNSSGWGPRATGDDSWCNRRSNFVKHAHGLDEAIAQDDLYGMQRINRFDNGRGIIWENRNLESGKTYGRKRDGGWSGSRASKMRYQNGVT